MLAKICTSKNLKFFGKLIPLIVLFVVCVILSSVDARKHNSYRRYYKKATTSSPTFATTPRPDYYGSQNIYTTVSYPYGDYRHSQIWRDSSLYDTNRKTKLKKNSRRKYQLERDAPYGSYGPSYGHELKAVEKDDTLDGVTGVIGPLIFPIPFLLSILPFAIPAIPIALALPFGNSTTDEG